MLEVREEEKTRQIDTEKLRLERFMIFCHMICAQGASQGFDPEAKTLCALVYISLHYDSLDRECTVPKEVNHTLYLDHTNPWQARHPLPAQS